jgi:hypothetical protein
MSPERITLHQAIAEERAQLWVLVRHNIAALRQLVNESQQLVDDARFERAAALPSRVIGTAAAPQPPASPVASD